MPQDRSKFDSIFNVVLFVMVPILITVFVRNCLDLKDQFENQLFKERFDALLA